jgi:hypothetical protein
VVARFSTPVQTRPVAQPDACTKLTGSLSWGIKLSAHGVDHPPHLAARLKKAESYTIILRAFMASSGANFFMSRFLYQSIAYVNTLRTGDADLRLYITTVQDG